MPISRTDTWPWAVQATRGKFLLAEELYSKALALDPNNPDALDLYGNLLAGVGRLKEALAMKQKLQTLEPFVPGFNGSTAYALWLNGQNDAAIAMRKDLLAGGDLDFVYLHIGALGRVLEFYERNIDAGDLVASATASLWHPSYAPVRKTERFKAYVRKAGLVDYWRAKGWPEFCRPTTADDFVCD